ncbi:hypothetical protein HHK36_022234 [Tetracentron sinense]|uniref:Uncharacterized protein n=1 Tax=Tetracentron sinense TaxID=13715 RepID=A0A835D9E5_TETSI|nr:hypothetical protein HHK36_022234 [Tetracentron sinense]
MESQDHSKIHTPGHGNHGVHVCHKCGWSFPNSHPSSKLRRAHKRVCGKKDKTHLTVSDEDQLSDEEHKSPGQNLAFFEGPKMEEKINNEKGGGGIKREGSSRSEDEEFSDAVTEFTRTEMVVVEDDQSVNATASSMANPMHDSQNRHPPDLEYSTHQVGSDTLFQDPTSISTIGSLVTSISDKLNVSLTVEPSNDRRNGSACLLSPAETETPVNAFSENTNTHTGEDVMDSSRAFAGQDTVAKGNGTTKLDENLQDMTVSPSKIASEASEEDSKLEEMDGFARVEISLDVTNAHERIIADTLPNDRIVDSKEEQIDDLGTKMSQFDISDSCSRSTEIESIEHMGAFIDPSPDSCSRSTQVESIEHMGAFVDNAQVEVDTERRIDILGDTIEGFDVKGEVNENLHALSVPDDIHLEAHPKIMVEDCKDHGPVKSELSPTLDCGEAARHLEHHSKTPVSEETFSGFLSSKSGKGAVSEEKISGFLSSKSGEGAVSEEKISGFLSSKSGEGAAVSPSVMQVSEDILQQESRASKSMVEEVSIKCEADISEAKAVNGEHLGSDGLEAFPDATRSDIKLNDTEKSPTVCSLEEQEACDFDHDLSCKILPENGTVVLSGEDVMLSPMNAEVHRTTNVVRGDNDSDHKQAEIENCDVAGFKSRKGAAEENDTLNTKMAPESAGNPSASQFHADGETIDSERLQENKSKPFDMVADSSEICINTSRFGNITENNDSAHEQAGIENCDVAGIESRKGATEENDTVNTKTAPESAGDPSASQFHADGETIDSERLQENKSKPLDMVADASEICISTNRFGNITENNDSDHEQAGIENCDVAGIEIRKGATEENDTVNIKLAPESAGGPSASHFHADGETIDSERLQENKSKLLDMVEDVSGIGISTNRLGNITETHSSLQNARDEDFQEGTKEVDIRKKEVQVECIVADSGITEPHLGKTKFNHSSDVGFFQSSSENLMPKEPMPSAVDAEPGVLTSEAVRNSSSRDSGGDASGIHSKSLQEEGDNLTKQQLGASTVVHADISVDSNTQSDSLEGYWGSVSDGTVPSTRYATDAPPIVDAVALPPTASQAPKKEAQKANSQKTRGASKDHISDNPDFFEAPSFMTLVEPGRGNDREAASSEIQTLQNPQQPKSSALQAGWFPSLTNVVNESQGRKKNEDIIAKVVNWSAGKPHTPLKNLLVEANLASKKRASKSQGDLIPATHKDEDSARKNALPEKTLPSVPTPKVTNTPATKRDSGKEWNSPARLPVSKRDKRKVKGKPYWVPFVCCSSVN